MANCTDIKQRLDGATAARQRLIEGSQVAVIMEAGSRVEYRQADLSTLTAEIARLQAEYNSCINPPGRVTALTRPVNFYF